LFRHVGFCFISQAAKVLRYEYDEAIAGSVTVLAAAGN
jgi:hypothetical protein